MTKIHGTKTILTDSEKAYYQEKIGDDYTICEQLGLTGARTSAYLVKDKDNHEYALKISNEEDDTWQKAQLEAYHKISSVFAQYWGDILLPKMIIAGDNFVLEPFYGVDFREEIYLSCTEEEKEKLCYDLAYFLDYLHHLDKFEYMPIRMLDNPDYGFILSYFKEILTHEEIDLIKKQLEILDEKVSKEENTVWTHGDLRAQNILYHNGGLAIIDFEMFGKRNVYYDFIPTASASFQISYTFWFDMIDVYNRISNMKVDKEKVWLLHRLGIYHEYGRVALDKNTSKDEFMKYIHLMRAKIDSLDKAYYQNKKS